MERDDHDHEAEDERLEGDPELGPDGRYWPVPCMVCGEITQLRCDRCHEPVCHAEHECPNGCDNLEFDTAFGDKLGEQR